MKGRLNPLPFLPFCILVICFIIFFISLNCFNNRFTCETLVPEPFAILFLRLAFITLGFCLSCLVIYFMIVSIFPICCTFFLAIFISIYFFYLFILEYISFIYSMC